MPSARERRFQLLISAACVIPALFWILQSYVSAKLNGRAIGWPDVAFNGFDWLSLGALTFIPSMMARRFPLRRGRWKRSIPAHVAGALLLGVAWASLGMLLGLALDHFPGVPPYLRSYLNWILITIPFAALIYLSLLGFIAAREREADASRLTVQLAEARLGALRMQLNPHFLFNSLNTVLVLLRDENTTDAARMLELLADVLRQVLRSDRQQEVPLSDELRFLEQYLAIEQVRFSDRLRVEWTIDDRARAALVPDFILQPLVENALKHGIAKRAASGLVAIGAHVSGTSLELSVRDDGPGIEQSESEGVGLTNTKERLRTLYGDAASVAIVPLAGGTEVVLRLPYRTS